MGNGRRGKKLVRKLLRIVTLGEESHETCLREGRMTLQEPQV